MSRDAATELAPRGVLRAAINTGNTLLVTGRDENGDPVGVAPDLAREIASNLGVPVRYVPFSRPSTLADAVLDAVWDVGLIGAEPARARHISFTAAYVEIEAGYLAPPGSALGAISDVDRAGVRIAVASGSAYDLWLTRNIKHATLVRSDSVAGAVAAFVGEHLDVLAGLRPGLLSEIGRLPGSRILEGTFMTVQQAVGTQKEREVGAAFLRTFVEDAKSSGLIARLLERHGVAESLSVAPMA